jgi:hypothetical protein
MKGWKGLLIVLALAFLLSSVLLGLQGIPFWVLFAGIVLGVKGFTKYLDKSMPFPGKNWAKGLGAGMVIVSIFGLGLFGAPTWLAPVYNAIFGGGIFTGAAVLGQPIGTTPADISACQAGMTGEQLDDTASVTVNAYDLAAAAGKTTAVDLSTSCRFYSNGVYVKASSDTSDPSAETGAWGLGDALSIYCGGTSYYTTPIENYCVRTKAVSLELDSYALSTASTGISIAGYDKNMNALTAAGNTTTADYDVTLGASEEEVIYLELTQDTANKAYNLIAVATASFNDIDYVKPSGSEFTQELTVEWLEDVSISDDDNAGTTNHTKDFKVYKLASPVLLREFESVKYKFTIKAGSTDPSATDNVWSTLDGGVVCFLDGTYSKGYQGGEFLDYHDHAEPGSEADVGWANAVWIPAGGYDCVVLEGN